MASGKLSSSTGSPLSTSNGRPRGSPACAWWRPPACAPGRWRATPGTDLLVAATDHVALAADGGDQQERRMTVHQFEQPRLVDVAGEHRAILQHVDAQQGGFQAEIARQAMQGRARSEHIAHAVFPAFRQPVGEVHQHQLLGLHPACFTCCMKWPSSGTVISPYQRAATRPARSASSSRSRTSPLARRTRPPSTRRLAIRRPRAD